MPQTEGNMAYQYKRRPSILRNLWVYRRLIGSAMLLGLMLWFIWVNEASVTVAFPFGLGHLTSSLGVVILLSALFGALIAILVMTVVIAARRIRGPHDSPDPALDKGLEEDRPPADYGAKTTEGFSGARWSS
jgi:uncharacterized integral membrane protein